MAVEQAEEEGGLSLLNSPYVNPGIVEDLGWLKEAYPSDGRTMVSWGGSSSLVFSPRDAPLIAVVPVGGKEIFANDVADFVSSLKKVSILPFPTLPRSHLSAPFAGRCRSCRALQAARRA